MALEQVEQDKIREIIDSCRVTGAVNPWEAAKAVHKYVSRVMQIREKAAFDEGQRSMSPGDSIGGSII